LKDTFYFQIIQSKIKKFNVYEDAEESTKVQEEMDPKI